MKNKYFSILVVAIVATVASFNIYSSQKETPMSDLALANVEALANDESDADPNTAYGYGLRSCTKNGNVTGARCALTYPQDGCRYSSEWGNCN